MKIKYLALLLMPMHTIYVAQADNGLITSDPIVWNCGYCGDAFACTPNSNVVAELDTVTWRLTIAGTGAMKNYFMATPWNNYTSYIAEVVVNTGVTTIGTRAFANCTQLTSTILSEGVEIIGESAFQGCSKLTYVDLPNTLTTIDNSAFRSTNIRTLNVPSSVTKIGQHSFMDCGNLKKLVIKDGATSLTLSNNPSNSAFLGCRIDTLYLGRNVNFPLIPNALWKQITISSNVTTLDNQAFKDCTIKKLVIADGTTTLNLGTTTAPPSPSGLPSTDSTQSPFYRCIVDEVYLGRNVNFPFVLFNTSSLKNFVLGNNITTLPNYLFYNCKYINKLQISSSVTTIANYAFDGMQGLSAIGVDASNRQYSAVYGLLYDKNQTKLVYCPQNISGSVILVNGLTTIPAKAFYGRNISAISIPASVTSIGAQAFMNCKWLSNISVVSSNSVFSAIDGVLYDKNLSKLIQYPEGKSENVFVIRNGITAIDDYAFANCILSTIYNFNSVPQDINAKVFENINVQNIDLYVLSEDSKTQYERANTWKNFKQIRVLTQAESIEMDMQYKLLFVSESIQLKAVIAPANTNNKHLVWTSSNPRVVQISPAGKITAVSTGEATVTASTTDGSNLTTSCVVQVLPKGTDNGDGYTSVDAAQLLRVSVIPNPAVDQITLLLPQYDQQPQVVVLYSFTGTELNVYNIDSEATSIDISHLQTGIYFLRAGNKSVKFVKK
jgi:hypothetical protein